MNSNITDVLYIIVIAIKHIHNVYHKPNVDAGRSLNVAYLYGAYEDSRNVMLVMELCKGGEMWNRVRSTRYSEKGAFDVCYTRRASHPCSVMKRQSSVRTLIMQRVPPRHF